MSSEKANLIAEKCIKKFESLPKNGKPEKGRQWTTLAGFVQETTFGEEESSLKVVSLATGTTCLGSSQMNSSGKVVHDSHAEVLARRAFTRYLFQELLKLPNDERNSVFLFCQKQKLILLKENISFHFYTSHTPCGDATIFQTIKTYKKPDNSNQDNSGNCPPNPKRIKVDGVSCTNCKLDLNRTGAKAVNGVDKLTHGLDYHEVGVLRIKPGRGIPTNSMSCSDKILKWNLLGCHGSLISIFLNKPIYLQSFIVGKCACDITAISRAVSERLDANCTENVLSDTPYILQPPKVFLSEKQFAFSKPVAGDSLVMACGSSVVWCDVISCPLEVVAKNGYRLGTIKRTEGLPQSVCKISRYSMFEQCKDVACSLFKSLSLLPEVHKNLSMHCSYAKLKSFAPNYQRTWENVKKEILHDWVEHCRELDCFELK